MTISVVIPTHNRPEKLRLAVRSVFAQTQRPHEIIVIDDCSNQPVTDDVFSQSPADIRCYLKRNTYPKGANASRNRGIECASGKWIAFLDDDDMWHPKKLATQLAFSESSHLDLSYTGKWIIRKNIDRELERRYNFITPNGTNLRESIMSRNFIGTTSTIMVLSEAIRRAGGFDVALPAMQDYDLYIRMIFAGSTVAGINKPLLDYTVDESDQAISKSLGKKLQATRHLLGKHNRKAFYAQLILNLFKGVVKHFVRAIRRRY